MTIPPLERENATAHYDEETGIAYINYMGFLDADASVAVYEWLADLDEVVEDLYGEVFDFRQVTEFMPDNLMEARKKSRRRNMRQDVHTLPVAMIVKDFYQEEILRGPMQNVPENQRKRIVRGMDEALYFLQKWREEHPLQTS